MPVLDDSSSTANLIFARTRSVRTSCWQTTSDRGRTSYFSSHTSLTLFSHGRRFPGLRSFLKDGEAQQYRNVAVHYVRGSQAILYVYNDEGQEIYTVELERLRTKENMHAVQQEFFERKSPEELRAEENQVERSRQHRNYKKFHREEYLRKQHLHAQWFRREIMQQEDMTWAGKDWLCRNYDKINRGFAVTKEELLLFAQQYLLKKNHSVVHK